MSPVNPISPTSPMSISPVSPVNMNYIFDMPEQPVLSPTVHLPRLLTSFQNTGSHVKRMSIQFQLPTPSPLSLSQTPVTAVPRRASTPQHRRSNATTCLTPLEMELISATTLLTTLPSPDSPRQNSSSTGSPSLRNVPSLQRQDAMEGLETMRSPPINQVIDLSLRNNRRPSETARRTSLSTQSVPEDSLTATFPSLSRPHPRRRRCRSSTSSTSTTSTNPSHICPRSPIHKRTRSNSHQRPHLDGLLSHLRNELIPLISVRSGQSHPSFPRNLLQYQLLTHDKLDSLARHYHQTIDAGEERWLYPCPIGWGKVWCGSVGIEHSSEEGRRLVDLTTKRRRWGRFIGLTNCESPTEEDEEGTVREMGDSVRERMEREWREGMRRQEEEVMLREKMMRGNW